MEQIINGVDVVCEYCGKHFIKNKFEYKRNKHHFCSQNCYHKFKIKPNEIVIHNDYAEIIIGNKVSLIDLEDVCFCKKYCWRISNKGYVTTTINRKTKHLHRLLLNPSNDKVIDHINRNPLDNRRMNLKICTQLENMQNRGLNKNSTTKIVGVYKDKNGKYIAHCQINKTRKTLGKFNTKNDAIKVLEKYRKDNKIG